MTKPTDATTPPNNQAEGTPDTSATTTAPVDRKPMSPEEAKLLKEVMKHKAEKLALAEKLKAFDGMDADKVKQLQANAELAVKAARDAENERLLAAGEWGKYKANAAKEHAAAMEGLRSQITAERDQLDAQLTRSKNLIHELTIGSAFASSAFIKDELALPPGKARKFYQDHFDVEDGKVVAYDAPRGDASRSPLVDAYGEGMTFDQAMQRIVAADPDCKELLRSSRKVQQASSAVNATPVHVGAGIDRLAHAVANGALPKTAAAVERANARWENKAGPVVGASMRDQGVDRMAKALTARAQPGR